MSLSWAHRKHIWNRPTRTLTSSRKNKKSSIVSKLFFGEKRPLALICIRTTSILFVFSFKSNIRKFTTLACLSSLWYSRAPLSAERKGASWHVRQRDWWPLSGKRQRLLALPTLRATASRTPTDRSPVPARCSLSRTFRWHRHAAAPLTPREQEAGDGQRLLWRVTAKRHATVMWFNVTWRQAKSFGCVSPLKMRKDHFRPMCSHRRGAAGGGLWKRPCRWWRGQNYGHCFIMGITFRLRGAEYTF